MGDAELLLGETDTKLASWKTQSRNRFDTSRFREVHPQLYQEYTNENQIRIFRLK